MGEVDVEGEREGFGRESEVRKVGGHGGLIRGTGAGLSLPGVRIHISLKDPGASFYRTRNTTGIAEQLRSKNFLTFALCMFPRSPMCGSRPYILLDFLELISYSFSTSQQQWSV